MGRSAKKRRKPLWTSVTKSSLGWTLTKPPRKTNIKTSKRKSRVSATQLSPSCTNPLVELLVVCLEVYQVVCPAVCLVMEKHLDPDLDLLFKKSINNLMSFNYKKFFFSCQKI